MKQLKNDIELNASFIIKYKITYKNKINDKHNITININFNDT